MSLKSIKIMYIFPMYVHASQRAPISYKTESLTDVEERDSL